MKKNLLIILFFAALPILSFAQKGGTCFNSGPGYISVNDNPNGQLDKHQAHTIELWIKTNNTTSDQKLFSKITNEFKSGYILGIENEQVKYETFNQQGTKSELIAGNVGAFHWVHIAASYEINGKMKLYVNGEFVGETDVIDGDNSFLEGTPLIIGAASWNTNTLSFGGQIEELRYWNVKLEAETIRDWMHRYATTNHPFSENLYLYHRYNTNSGTTVIDHSPTAQNPGTMTSSVDWSVSTVPFKANQYFSTSGPAIGGIWAGSESYTLEDLTLTGVDFTGERAVVFESNTANTSYCAHPVPTGIDQISCLFWAMIPQNNPTVSFSFDMSSYDLSGIEEIFLMESLDIADFTNATMIEGTLSGNTFSIASHTMTAASETDVFYALGFKTLATSTEHLADNTTPLKLFPNPSNGSFQLEIEAAELTTFQLRVLDYSGKLILTKQLNDIQGTHTEQFDWTDLPRGLYMLQLQSKNGLTTQKIILE